MRADEVTKGPVLETRGLTKEFRGFTAVDNVNLQVQEGHGLIKNIHRIFACRQRRTLL